MTKMRCLLLVCMLAAVPFVRAGAQTLYHLAENQVPVAMTEVRRLPGYTEVHLKALRALEKVCWTQSGANSPYLVSAGKRYRFVGSEAVAYCPQRRPYRAEETMILRFQPLDPSVREFSLVEGEGGENQLVDPASSKERYWNFLRVKLP